MNKNNKVLNIEKNKESPINIVNPKNIQNEMLHFKDDILKDVKDLEINFSENFKESKKLMDEKLKEYEMKLETYNQRLFKISQLALEDKLFKEKLTIMFQEREDIKEQILTIEIKFNELEKNLMEK